MRDVDERLAWFLRNRPSGAGRCAEHVWHALDVPRQGLPDATAVYHRAAPHGIHRGPSPRGAIHYWTGGSAGHGHVGIAADDGLNIASVDVNGPGTVGVRNLSWFASRWPRLRYRGWSWWWGDINTYVSEEDSMKGHKDYSEASQRVAVPVDGAWHDLPDLRAMKGSPFRAPLEEHDMYARLYPEFTKGGHLSVEVRYRRANGDNTGYDELQVTEQAASVPITRHHREIGEKGLGGSWQFKLSGVGITCEMGTRYQKLYALDVDWV